MRKFIFASLALLATSFAASAAPSAPNNNEVPLIFHCQVDPQHTVSIIASDDGPVYAYHKGDNAELVIYGNATNVRYAYSAFSGGGSVYYRFIKGAYSYQVYSASFPDGTVQEGLKVFKRGEQIASKKCQGDAISNVPNYDPASQVVEDSQDDQITYGF